MEGITTFYYQKDCHQQPTVTHMSQDMESLESQETTCEAPGFSESPLAQIELFSRMICFSVKHPFPRSKGQIGCAIIGIKRTLKLLSLAELVQGSSTVPHIHMETLRPDLRPTDPLNSLLDHELIRRSLPSLREAMCFVHPQDQQEIYDMLRIKLGAFKPEDLLF